MISYVYYLEGSTVLLKCLCFEHLEWKGLAHSKQYFEESVKSIHENGSMWNVTDRQSINPSLHHKIRLKVIDNKQAYEFVLQISNASVMDEGLYFCQNTLHGFVFDRFILKTIGM